MSLSLKGELHRDIIFGKEIVLLKLPCCFFFFLASNLCLVCCDFQTLSQTIERIPTISTQLKIVATVKATMIGADGKDCFQSRICIDLYAFGVKLHPKAFSFASFLPKGEVLVTGLEYLSTFST